MHKVDRRPGHQGQLDGPVGGLTLHPGGAGNPVVDGIGLAAGCGLFGQHVDSDAVLGVHGDQGAVVGRLLHSPEDLAVVAVEDARVGHEELEACDALAHQGVHLLECRFVDAAQDHVKGVVDGTLALGLRLPCLEAVPDVLSGFLHGEVDDGGRASPGGGPGADLKGV